MDLGGQRLLERCAPQRLLADPDRTDHLHLIIVGDWGIALEDAPLAAAPESRSGSCPAGLINEASYEGIRP